MLDFTSAHYLGLHHTSEDLRGWEQLATGVPAAMAEPQEAYEVAWRVARLQGCEEGVLAPSTLHLFWDLFGILSREKIAIYQDEGIYPIASWGVERAAARGVTVQRFPHHDAEVLRWLLNCEKNRKSGRRPVVVTDGFCPGSGRVAPLSDYMESVRVFRGLLVLDDTQALGILGHTAWRNAPYGKAGGGSLQWSNVFGADILVISSLAKGFGVPAAVLSGSKGMIQFFKEKSETRVHCSPPSTAVIHAAKRALVINDTRGDALRLSLARQVQYFRERLKKIGLCAWGGLFPVQTLALPLGYSADLLHERLIQKGIRAVLHGGHRKKNARISFIITARHCLGNIDCLIERLGYCLKGLYAKSIPTFSLSLDFVKEGEKR